MALTGLGLVEFAKSKIGTAYVYGMKGEVLTLERFNELQNLYGEEMVWNSDINKVGQVCVDCSGLISWYTGVGYNAAGHKENAIKVEPISTLSTAPLGAILWQSGHVGVYAGIENGKAICYEAKGSAFGTVKSNVEGRGFTHWLLMDYITYSYEETTEVKTINVAINGLVKQVSTVTVDGNNYVKLQDLNNTTLGISYNEMPIISINSNQIEVKINGEAKQVSAINVEGNNYIKLQDLNGAAISIGYDGVPTINVNCIKDINMLSTRVLREIRPETETEIVYSNYGTTINGYANQLTVTEFQDFLVRCLNASGITNVTPYFEVKNNYYNTTATFIGVKFTMNEKEYKWYYSYAPAWNPPLYMVYPKTLGFAGGTQNDYSIGTITTTASGSTISLEFTIEGLEKSIVSGTFEYEQDSTTSAYRLKYTAKRLKTYIPPNQQLIFLFDAVHFSVDDLFIKNSGLYAGIYYKRDDNVITYDLPIKGVKTTHDINSLFMAFSPKEYTIEELEKVGYTKITGNFGNSNLNKELASFFYSPIRAKTGSNINVLVDLQDESKFCYVYHYNDYYLGVCAICCVIDKGTMFN